MARQSSYDCGEILAQPLALVAISTASRCQGSYFLLDEMDGLICFSGLVTFLSSGSVEVLGYACVALCGCIVGAWPWLGDLALRERRVNERSEDVSYPLCRWLDEQID